MPLKRSPFSCDDLVGKEFSIFEIRQRISNVGVGTKLGFHFKTGLPTPLFLDGCYAAIQDPDSLKYRFTERALSLLVSDPENLYLKLIADSEYPMPNS